MKNSDRYLKIVAWSEEDGCYIGRVPGLVVAGVRGDNEEQVYRELCQSVDSCIERYEAEGKPLPPATQGKSYSGKFNLRVGKELHEYLAIRALQEKESLNSYCVKLLRNRSGL